MPAPMPERQLRPSQFNLHVPDGGSTVWFNSVSGASLRLSRDQSALLDRLIRPRDAEFPPDRVGPQTLGDDEELPADLRDELVRLGFLVPEGSDEYAREHARFLSARDGSDLLLLTVAPTLACNLRCSYCFQQDVTRLRTMVDEIRDALIDLVRVRAEGGMGGLIVQWYGGEPLLAADLIRHCTQRFLELADAYGFEYRAELLTNGLLLPRCDLWKELGAWRVRALQIPLDGLPETYAERKEIRPDRARAFYDFLYRHVEDLTDLVGSVVIRINVDRDNIEEAARVVDEFARHGVTDRRIDFRLGFLNARRGVIDCIPHDCFEDHEFQDQEDAFREHLNARGFRVFGRPAPRPWPCAAPLRGHLAIDPAGRIGKCVPAIGTEQSVFSRLRPGDVASTQAELEAAERPYGRLDPFTASGCAGCRLLPVCLGSCPKDPAGGVEECSTRRGIEQRILSFARR